MSPEEFLIACLEAECIVVPLRVFACYDPDGNIAEDRFIGIRYATIEHTDTEVMADPNCFRMIEEAAEGPLFATPEEALNDWKEKRDAKRMQKATKAPEEVKIGHQT